MLPLATKSLAAEPPPGGSGGLTLEVHPTDSPCERAQSKRLHQIGAKRHVLRRRYVGETRDREEDERVCALWLPCGSLQKEVKLLKLAPVSLPSCPVW